MVDAYRFGVGPLFSINTTDKLNMDLENPTQPVNDDALVAANLALKATRGAAFKK